MKRPPRIVLEPDPVIEAYKKHVDRTLIRENLRRSITERFENLMAMQQFAVEMRRAMNEARKAKETSPER